MARCILAVIRMGCIMITHQQLLNCLYLYNIQCLYRYLTVNAFVISAKRLSGEENNIGGTLQVLALVVGLNVGAVGGWGVLALE